MFSEVTFFMFMHVHMCNPGIEGTRILTCTGTQVRRRAYMYVWYEGDKIHERCALEESDSENDSARDERCIRTGER